MTSETTNVRKPLRVPTWDYATPGACFVTVVTTDRASWFGHIASDVVCLNSAGAAVHSTWDGLPLRYRSVQLDELVVMPNHVHAIIWLIDDLRGDDEGAASSAPTLGQVMRTFKSSSAVCVNRALGRSGRVWQRGYFERIIRNDGELHDLRRYIAGNPRLWSQDHENPGFASHE